MDFGEVALAGAFLMQEQFASERKFPLRVYYCDECYAVQVVDKVPPDILFHNYFYFSSSIGTLRNHFSEYAEEITRRFLEPAKATVLEFGCNDGVLLRPLADQGIHTVLGVDPAKNIVATIDDPRVKVVNNFFTEEVATHLVAEHGKVDVIMANNVYAHIPDIQGTTRAVELALTDDGVFVFEVHYLGKVVEEMQYDMIYHEHLYYYSLLSAIKHFDRYNMVVFDIKPVPIHAGSMRFYVCKRGSKYSQPSEAVRNLEAEERKKGYDRYETFKLFSDDVNVTRTALMDLLSNLKGKGKSIAGYGASGRANTMIQYCSINHEQVDYMIDDAPAKAGYYTPGSHFLIHPSSILTTPDAPDYVLVFAWSFFEEICKRNATYLSNGGKMILPLPNVSIFPPEK
jgi:methylation protein EvaC